MPLKQIESYPAGGVSSRDNPVNMPNDRYLRMVNFWPQQDGSLRLRDGYTLYASGLDQGTPIHSITGVVGPGPDYKRLIVFWQNITPYVLDPATKIITSPAVRGTAIQRADRFCYFYTPGRLYAFNGTDAKWFDGFVWRDVGLPLPDKDSVSAMTVVTSVREFSASEASAATLTLSSGGTFPADKVGRTFYCAFYDLDLQEIGPATIPVGPSNGLKKFGLNQQLQAAVLPGSPNARWVKLPALTDDGKNDAHFAVTSSKSIVGGVIENQSFALTGSSTSSDPAHFANPSFSVALSAVDLSAGPVQATIGGVEQINSGTPLPPSANLTISGTDAQNETDRGGIVYDAGRIGVNIIGSNGFSRAFEVYYNYLSNPANLAIAFATAINNDPFGFLSAVASGAVVTVTPTALGSGTVYTIGTPYARTLIHKYFVDGQSFNLAKDISQFGQQPIYDYGTVQVGVNGIVATAPYGKDSTSTSIAPVLAAAISGLAVGVKATSVGPLITIAINDAGFFVDLTIPDNAFAVDDVFGIGSSGDPTYDGYLFTVLQVTGNVVKIANPRAVLAITSGIAFKILSVAAGVFTATIAAPVFFTSYRVNDLIGIPGSAIGGPDAGFQFYGSLYMRTAGAHVGNRSKIGQRVIPVNRSNVRVLGTMVFADNEQELLVGRTADGAQTPHACIDKAGTWLSVKATTGVVSITNAETDGNAELPERNFPPAGTLDFNKQIAPDPPIVGTFKRAWVESDHCCGAINGQPTVYRSGSAQDNREGKFVGLPEQSWSPVDIETYPTAAPISAGHGYSGESIVFSKEDSATLIELAGETGWQGPYNIGGAGQFAYAKGWKNLPYSLTGEKQLATGSPDGPIPISDEYEQALLSKIGDQYLGDAEIVPVRLPHKKVEVLRISARDKAGVPFTVIHDFNMRDARSPYGQGYEEVLLGPLASGPPTLAAVRDENDQPLILAGGGDGNLYKLYDGISDNGNFFTAETLSLKYVGPQRTAIKFLEWYGDPNAKFFIAKPLTSIFDSSQMQALCPDDDKIPSEASGDEGSNHYQVNIADSEMVHVYVLLRLKGYAGGTMDLSDPPHMPVESYGRVLMVSPSAGAGRP